ncbi:MAG TPA: glutamate racemase, partial [Flavobacterium sp.]|nr:glutamate racemase [Flavobacterium sp.]
YLIPQIKKILPPEIKIIDPGEAVARQTKNVLLEKVGLHSGNHTVKTVFYTNSDAKVLQEILGNKYPVRVKDF